MAEVININPNKNKPEEGVGGMENAIDYMIRGVQIADKLDAIEQIPTIVDSNMQKHQATVRAYTTDQLFTYVEDSTIEELKENYRYAQAVVAELRHRVTGQ